MEFNEIFYVYTIACVFALMPLVKNWIKNDHSFSNMFNIVYILYIGITSAQFYLFNGNEEILNVRIFESVHLINVFMIVSSSIYAFYMMYISGWKRWHSINIAFVYIVFQQLRLYNEIYMWVYLGLSSVSVFFFMYKGIKYKNGKHFSFGTVLLIDYISFIEVHSVGNNALYVVSKLIQIIFMSLGTLGVIDKYILYDVKKNEEINNSWIGGILDSVTSDKNEKIVYVHAKTLSIQCPICDEVITKEVSAKKIIERKKNPKGLVEMFIYSNHTKCNHDFRVFIDKDYNVMGFETNVQH